MGQFLFLFFWVFTLLEGFHFKTISTNVASNIARKKEYCHETIDKYFSYTTRHT
jgi:hypothetical protein